MVGLEKGKFCKWYGEESWLYQVGFEMYLWANFLKLYLSDCTWDLYSTEYNTVLKVYGGGALYVEENDIKSERFRTIGDKIYPKSLYKTLYVLISVIYWILCFIYLYFLFFFYFFFLYNTKINKWGLPFILLTFIYIIYLIYMFIYLFDIFTFLPNTNFKKF